MRRRLLMVGKPMATWPKDNEIWYTSLSGSIIKDEGFGAFGTIVSHTYTDKGIVTYDTPLSNVPAAVFMDNSDFYQIWLPDSITIIEPNAFLSTFFQEFWIGEGVTYIGNHAFGYSYVQPSFYFKSATSRHELDVDAFGGTTIESIYVPRAGYEDYCWRWYGLKEYIKPYDFKL